MTQAVGMIINPQDSECKGSFMGRWSIPQVFDPGVAIVTSSEALSPY